MPSVVNTNLRAAQDRKERTNDLYSRTQERVSGWESSPSGLKSGGITLTSVGGARIRTSSSATKYSELSSESLTFVKGGSEFKYPKQWQFIPASALDFGSAFDFTANSLVDYDDDQYDVLFILKNMQTYSVEGSDESSNQFLQVSAESKSATGFTPTANVGVRVLSSTTVTSFDEEAFAFNGSDLSDPTYATDSISDDAMHDFDTDDVTALTVTYTLTYTAVKGSGDFLVEGFIRAGTEDTGNTSRFIEANYEQSNFSELRDAGFGDGSVTRSVSFTFDAALGADPCKVVATITNYDQLSGSTATLAGEITEIVYTTESGATRSITGVNRADAIVMAR